MARVRDTRLLFSEKAERSAPERVRILWLGIDQISFAETVELVVEMCRKREPGYVVTPNVDHFVRARNDQDLRAAYANATLSVPDGVPILWSARLLGTPLLGRVNGTDLFEALCTKAVSEAFRVFLLGGAHGVAQKARTALEKRHPAIRIVGTLAPWIDERADGPNDGETARQIREADPHLVFVAFGCPKQELWIARNYQRLGGAVCVGVGISFEFIAGTQPRAPRWMQRASLEWFWRLLHDPRRLWRRYLVEDLPFAWWILRERLRRALRRKRPSSEDGVDGSE
jgi:N-acetylglucosaminyldiphosphoundecaprenol N-acetyl-beta-D-mannosaminyltransferase